VLKFDPLKVAFDSDLSIVSIYCVLNTIPILVNLLNDDLGIAIGE
jgi:hypothetical protein